MKTENVIQVKSYAFAVRIIRLYQHLTEKKKNLSFLSKFYVVAQALAQMSKKRLVVNRGQTLLQR